jgi:hypothetical protein
LRKLFIASAIAGVLIELAVLASDAWLRLSYVDAYQAIHMGMSYKQVQTLLEEQRIWCGFHEAAPSGSRPQIRFSDYWRDYLIVFDPKTGVVVGKGFVFRHRRGLASRIADAIYLLRQHL